MAHAKPETPSDEDGYRTQVFEADGITGRPVEVIIAQKDGITRLECSGFDDDFDSEQIDELIAVLRAAVAKARAW